MNKEDVYIPDASYAENQTIQHGGKWSEEAKRRYAEARKAGRSVYDMFSSAYTKTASGAARTTRSTINSAGKRVNIMKRNVVRAANNVANRTIYKDDIRKAKANLKNTISRNNSVREATRKYNMEQIKKSKSIGEAQAREQKYRDNEKNLFEPARQKEERAAKKKVEKASNHTLGEIARDSSKTLSKELKKRSGRLGKDIEKGSKKLGRTLSDVRNGLGKGAKKTADGTLGILDNLHESDKERKIRKSAEKKAKAAYEKTAKSKKRMDVVRGLSGGLLGGRKNRYDPDKAYRDAYDKEMKKDTKLSVDSISKSLDKKTKKLKNKAAKKANKVIGKVEKKVNTALRNVDDMVETSSEKRERRLAEVARRSAEEKQFKKDGGLFGKRTRSMVKSDLLKVESKLRDVVGDRKGSAKAAAKSKDLENKLVLGQLHRNQRAGDKAAKKHEKNIYDKQVKFGRFKVDKSKKKNNRVKHSDVFIPGKTGITDILLHKDY